MFTQVMMELKGMRKYISLSRFYYFVYGMGPNSFFKPGLHTLTPTSEDIELDYLGNTEVPSSSPVPSVNIFLQDGWRQKTIGLGRRAGSFEIILLADHTEGAYSLVSVDDIQLMDCEHLTPEDQCPDDRPFRCTNNVSKRVV